MRVDQKEKAATTGLLKPVLFGVLSSIIVCFITLIVFSAIMHFRSIPLIAINPFAIAASVLGSFSGGYAASRIAKSNGLILGAATGFIFFAIIVLIGLAVYKDFVSVLTLIKMAISVLSGATGGIVGVNTSTRRKR